MRSPKNQREFYEWQARVFPHRATPRGPLFLEQEKMRKRFIRECFDGLIPRLSIDIGCGEGIYTGTLECLSDRTVAIDISLTRIQRAKRFAKSIDFIVCDAMKLPLRSDLFDALTCIEVLEHLPSDTSTIMEIIRVLKSKGSCIFSLPNPFGLDYYFYMTIAAITFGTLSIRGHPVTCSYVRKVFIEGGELHGHFRGYTPKTVMNKLSPTSLQIIKISGLDIRLSPFHVWLSGKLPPIAKLMCAVGSFLPRISGSFLVYCRKIS